MTLQIVKTSDLAACHAIRRTVFVEEQNVPEDIEVDEKDAVADHFLAILDGAPVGTMRILVLGDTGKIGRIAVLRKHRGTGIGKALVQAAIDHLRGKTSVDRAYLSAQTQALPFYESLGFRAYGDEYDDAGIPHRDMDRAL